MYFRASFSGAATDSGKAKKKKDGRKKKSSSLNIIVCSVGFHTELEEVSENEMEVDKGLILQLPQKEFARKSNQRTMDDLGSRQLAYVLAGLSSCMPSDLVEVGGSCVVRLQIQVLQVVLCELPSSSNPVGTALSALPQESILLDSASRYKRQKDKAGETQALQKAGFA